MATKRVMLVRRARRVLRALKRAPKGPPACRNLFLGTFHGLSRPITPLIRTNKLCGLAQAAVLQLVVVWGALTLLEEAPGRVVCCVCVVCLRGVRLSPALQAQRRERGRGAPVDQLVRTIVTSTPTRVVEL